MIAATYLKAHRTASSLRVKKGSWTIRRAKGGMNTKLHAITDANSRPLSFFIIAGRISDYTGAASLLDDLPKAQRVLAGRGYDAAWFSDPLEQKSIQPCIPG